jgi:RNA methyltransferase, TrmH family
MDWGAPITSKSNAKVKALRAAFDGKAARPGELLGLEGEHLLAEAMRSGLEFETVFVRAGSERVLERSELRGLKAKQTVLLSAEVFASAVETESPQGIAATVSIPELKLAVSSGGSGLVLVLEGLQDPGNLGTLLRSAEAFGASFVMMTPETVNPWNSKVVRASAGSVFRMPVVRASLAEIRRRLTALGLRMFATVTPRDVASPLMETYLGAPCAVLIGNEGAGLSAEAIATADAIVTIPCATESLNAAVAGSVILYEAMRQRAAKGGKS